MKSLLRQWQKWDARKWLVIAWGQATIATSMSLYYSEIVGLAPCKLCWEQRIFMYPLVLMLAIAYKRKDKSIDIYALPLAAIGWLIAVYHNIDYFLNNFTSSGSFLPTCGGGVSCTQIRPVFWFITIPELSLLAFSIIIAGLWMYRRENLLHSTNRPKIRR